MFPASNPVNGTGSTHMSMQQQSYERMLEGLRRDFGPCLEEFKNPRLQELMLNPDGRLWREVAGEGMSDTGIRFTKTEAEQLFTDLAGILGLELTARQPIIECELPIGGHRFAGLIAPIVQGGPAFAIRVQNSLGITLQDFAARGVLTDKSDPANRHRIARADFIEMVEGKSHLEIIELGIRLRKNMLIIGGTGSGKTTLLNAIADSTSKINPDHRIVIIEDTREVICASANVVQMRTNRDAQVDMTKCLMTTLRLRPDRIFVGEVRDGAALALLKMWGTGHPGGLATVHADDCYGGLVRLERMIEENPGIRANPHSIADAIDLCIFIEKDKEAEAGRKVREVAVVERYDNSTNRYVLRQV
ncbi:conjugal transfer protein TrbB [Cupriavidus gilardii]|nr:conjugal transfer protein TrbB [Cupriavidus gilardii]